MKNIRIFYLEIFPFLVVKFSIYLNRRVFVMTCNKINDYIPATLKETLLPKNNFQKCFFF